MKGRKRHLLVDTESLVLKAKVHSAKVLDQEGIKPLLDGALQRFAVTLDHPALWSIDASLGELRKKIRDAAKCTVLQSKAA